MAAPTKKQFDLIVVSWILLELAWGLPSLWANRKVNDKDANGVVKDIAGAVLAVH